MKLSRNITAVLAATMVLTACGGSSSQSPAQQQEKLNAQDRTIDMSGEQRFEDWDQEGDILIQDHQYHFIIHRASSDDLPMVSGDISPNAKFHDNKATLTIQSGDRQVFQQTFTKNDFASLVESDMLAQSLLRGFVFDPSMNEGKEEMIFAVSVGYPQDDEMYVPMLLKVSPKGKVSIEKDTEIEMVALSDDLTDEEGV